MKLQNEKYTITISVDEDYKLDAPEEQKYDLLLNPRDFGPFDMYIVFSVKVEEAVKSTRIALVGDFYSYDLNCAVLEEDLLTVLQNDAVVQLDLTSKKVVKMKEWDSFGSNIGIHKAGEGYLIHGGQEIIMLDQKLQQKWNFEGRDMFVTTTDKNALELTEKFIRLYDFGDNFYELDYDGNVINETIVEE